jgi:nicotinate-nucleotide adenylyltransferase
LGHLRTALEVGQELNLDKVYLIPAASPPHKSKAPVMPFHHRLAMTRLAIGDCSSLEALDIEGQRPGLSYSIETLREFQQFFSPDSELFFILGDEAFLDIRTWKEYPKLFEFAHFVIIQRKGIKPNNLEGFLLELKPPAEKTADPYVFRAASGKTLILMGTTPMDISSTQVRALVRDGKSIRFLVPEAVRNYIMKKQLYRNYEDP